MWSLEFKVGVWKDGCRKKRNFQVVFVHRQSCQMESGAQKHARRRAEMLPKVRRLIVPGMLDWSSGFMVMLGRV